MYYIHQFVPWVCNELTLLPYAQLPPVLGVAEDWSFLVFSSWCTVWTSHTCLNSIVLIGMWMGWLFYVTFQVWEFPGSDTGSDWLFWQVLFIYSFQASVGLVPQIRLRLLPVLHPFQCIVYLIIHCCIIYALEDFVKKLWMFAVILTVLYLQVWLSGLWYFVGW